MSHKPIELVQALRGIAALLVVFWHASRYLGSRGTGIGGTLFAPGAAMGVDLFFLMSGFIMYHTTRDSDGSWRYTLDFAVKRASRIWPVWLVALALYVAICTDVRSFSDPDKLGWLVRSILLLPSDGPGSVAPMYGMPVLAVGWTLNYEMYFYAFFALAIPFGRRRWLAIALWLFATLVLVPYATGRLGGSHGWTNAIAPNNDYRYGVPYLGLVTNAMVLFFAAGIACGAIYHSRATVENRKVLYAFAALATAAVVAQYAFRFRPWHGVLNWGLSLMPFFLAWLLLSRAATIRVPSAMRYLGDISFSLYLFHPLVQESYDLALRAMPTNRFASGLPAFAITTILSLAVAAGAHRCLERELCGALRRALLRRRREQDGLPLGSSSV